MKSFQRIFSRLLIVIFAMMFASYSQVTAAPGDVDPSFNPQISWLGGNPFIYAVRVQQDGKIVIAGQFDTVNGESRNDVARLNPDGSLDTNFTSPFPALDNNNLDAGYAQDVVLQADGKVLVGGVFNFNGQFKYLVRLNSDGTLDNTFNANIGGNNIYKIVVQPDGKIIIGSNGLGTVDDVPVNYLARLNTDGSLDTALGWVGNIPPFVYSIALQPDGKIVVGCSGAVVRLNANGTPDFGFQFDYPIELNPITFALAVQPDGKILAGGRNVSFDNTAAYLARFNS